MYLITQEGLGQDQRAVTALVGKETCRASAKSSLSIMLLPNWGSRRKAIPIGAAPMAKGARSPFRGHYCHC